MHKIGLFEEARRRGIEPVILFMIDPDPKAEKAYSLLRRSFPGTALLPARNLTVAKGLRYGDAFPHASTLAASLEISELAPPLRSLVDGPGFSFQPISRNARPVGAGLSPKAHDELLGWIRRLRFQLREIELCLIYEQSSFLGLRGEGGQAWPRGPRLERGREPQLRETERRRKPSLPRPESPSHLSTCQRP